MLAMTLKSKTPPELEPLMGKQIVIDTDSSYVYIGLLEAAHSSAEAPAAGVQEGVA